MPRRPTTMSHEGARAQLAMAGIRQLKQATVAPAAGAGADYTVTEPETRRVIVIHTNTTAGAIRFNYREQGGGVAAAATDIPVIAERYFVVDARKDDVLSFWNTTGAGITINIMEIQ